MINLGTKHPDYSATSAPAADVPMKTEYPRFSIKTDKPIKFPEGAFHAKLKMRAKGGEWGTDEHGKKTYTHHMEVMGMHPKMEAAAAEAENAAEEASPAEEKDAATTIMESMRGARQRKMVHGE